MAKKLSLLEKFECQPPVLVATGLEVRQGKLDLACDLFVELGFLLIRVEKNPWGDLTAELIVPRTAAILHLVEPTASSHGADSRRYSPNTVSFEVANNLRIVQAVGAWADEKRETYEVDPVYRNVSFLHLKGLLCFSIELREIKRPAPKENKWLYEKSGGESQTAEEEKTPGAAAPTNSYDLRDVPAHELLD
ncbi:hypothetical protein A2619_00985 [candidate division WWE3 bacterium RIFOXYD1_FULL_39_9]|uniref:Uncharacterized protein n=1 Tax=candidate division WWE3 bacterium RIFOXYD1_FULL_39_9 TaxID=1802649 RepID=A0A1F4XBH8_UNCKA|nr:MAG: hypothetical protein A2619_00985 [candidate division WWE3 bacterium RIFOXYD1_FULL_39_9]